MRRAHHIIHRQSIEVVFERSNERLGVQDRLAEVYYQQILPELDKVFGEFEEELPPVVTVPTLTINCGMLREADWEVELTASVCNIIRDEFRRYRASRATPPMTTDQRNAEFIHFLKTGQFQWDSRKKLPADYEAQLLLDKSFLDELTSAFWVADDTSTRLFHYCSSGFIIQLAEALTADYIQPAGVAYITFLKKAGIAAAIWAKAIIGAYHATCRKPSAGQKTETAFIAAMTDRVWTKIDGSRRQKIVEQLIRHAEAGENAGHAPFLNTGFLARLIPLIADEFPAAAAILQQMTITLDWASKSPETQYIRTAKQGTDPAADIMQHLDTSYYISNAGLILAYPFITSLLQSTGLLDNDEQFFPGAKDKAAVLLQHLVCDSPTIADENELPLNKILVGLQPTSFVDPSLLEYTSRAQRGCKEVLCAIITHWDILRNTSTAGLQETFLQREGKLTLRTAGWLLQVDASGVDVLLANLPWPIGIIKLPWMDHVLHVEWA